MVGICGIKKAVEVSEMPVGRIEAGVKDWCSRYRIKIFSAERLYIYSA